MTCLVTIFCRGQMNISVVYTKKKKTEHQQNIIDTMSTLFQVKLDNLRLKMAIWIGKSWIGNIFLTFNPLPEIKDLDNFDLNN